MRKNDVKKLLFEKEAEICVIGKLLQDDIDTSYAIEQLKERDFYNTKMGSIFNTLKRVKEQDLEMTLDNVNDSVRYPEYPISNDLYREIMDKIPEDVDFKLCVDQIKKSAKLREMPLSELYMSMDEDIDWDFKVEIQNMNNRGEYRESSLVLSVTPKEASMLSELDQKATSFIDATALKDLYDRVENEARKVEELKCMSRNPNFESSDFDKYMLVVNA